MANVGTKQYIGGELMKRVTCRCPKCGKEHKKRLPWPGPLPKKPHRKFCGEHSKLLRHFEEEFIYYG